MPRNQRRFVNPYTFIPLGVSLEDRFEDNWHRRDCPLDEKPLLSGVINCELIPRTAIAIPDTSGKELDKGGETSSKKTKEERTYRFFRYPDEDTPVIPGSSIRGPIRSVFEALTDSCMRTSNIGLHSVSKAKRPGLIFKAPDGYELYDADRYRVKDKGLRRLCSSYSIGQEETGLSVVEGEGYSPGKVIGIGTGTETGYYMQMNELNGSNPSFFTKGRRVQILDSNAFTAFEKNVEMYGKNAEDLPDDDDEKRAKRIEAMRNATNYQNQLDAMKSSSGGTALPVWYDIEAGQVHLAPAQISRTVYAKTSASFLGNLSQDKCASSDMPCPACRLFGFVAEGGDEARCHAGKVRFSDATLKRGSPYETRSECLLPDLMRPRTSSLEFYMRPQNRSYNVLFTPDTPGTDIAGRKFYWHHKHGLQAAEEWTSYNSCMEIVEGHLRDHESQTVFEFSIFFDGVTERELNQLVYAVTLGQYWGEGAAELCHKIGHGKPVGLGSVYIKVVSVLHREFDSTTLGYTVSSSDAWKLQSREEIENLFSPATLEPIKKATSFDAIDDDEFAIDYPRTVVGGDIFDWFSANRQPFNKGQFIELLPEVTDADQSLPRQPKQGHGEVQSYDGRGAGRLKMDGTGWSLDFNARNIVSGFTPKRGDRVAFNAGKDRTTKKRFAKDIELESGMAGGVRRARPAQDASRQRSGSQGKVKNYFADRHFGFIRAGKQDLFFHKSALANGYTPTAGDSVTFTIGKGKKGPCAENVRPSA